MAVAAAQTADDFLRRVPPQDIEAEMSVLGAVLLENEAINQALEVLNPDDFYRESNREIFRMMTELSDRNQPVDAITMTDALRTRGKLEAIGGPAYLAELAACVPSARNVFSYARLVRDKAVLRALAMTAHQIIEESHNGGGANAPEFAAEAAQRIEAVASRLRPKPTELGRMASEIVPTPVTWLWEGRIPLGKLTVIDGDPGVSKSFLTIYIAAQLSRGRAFADGAACEPARSIFICAEDGDGDTVVPRLIAAEGDRDSVRVIKGVIELRGELHPLTLPDDIPIIEAQIIADGAKLIVLDPGFAFLSDKTDSHVDASVRRVLAEIAAMAERTGAAVIFIRHLNKSSNVGSAIYRGGGSIAVVAAARAAFLVGFDPTDDAPIPERRRILAAVKTNLGPLPPSLAFRPVGEGVPHLEWLAAPCELIANDLLQTRNSHNAEALDDAIDFLNTELVEGARPVREIDERAKALKISKRTLERARKRLKIRPFKRGFASEWFISLPPTAADEADEEQPATTAVEEAEKVRI